MLFLTAEVINIQRKLLATEEVMRQIWEQIMLASEGLNDMQRLLAEFTREAPERDNLMKSLLVLHEKEMGVMETAASPLQLTKQQTETLFSKLKTFEEITDIGVRSNKVADVTDLITPSLFTNFADAVEEKYPLLRNIIKSLVINNPQERNVLKSNEHKMLCGHQALALLLNVRNSNCRNDFPLLFGLLCVSYGQHTPKQGGKNTYWPLRLTNILLIVILC